MSRVEDRTKHWSNEDDAREDDNPAYGEHNLTELACPWACDIACCRPILLLRDRRSL